MANEITIQQMIASDIQKNNYKTINELIGAVNEIINKEIFENLDDAFYSINNRWVYYGIWKFELWVSTAHFGSELSRLLSGLSIITHDENKTVSLRDYEKDIYDIIQQWAYDYWSDQPWKEAEEDYR